MTDQTGAPAGEIAAPADDSELSIEDARKLIFAEDPEIPAESAEEATAEPESSKEDSAPEKDPAEDAPEADPEADQPEPIEPPRSWTKAEKERFQSLPRETQEYLHTREQERERDFRRSQNEIAEERKAAKAEREAAEKVRQQYEANLPALMQELQNAQQQYFADIRTVDDVTRLANEDPFRYLQWQAHQTKVQAVKAQKDDAEREQSKAEQTKWAQHVQKENELAAEYIPELADKAKGEALTKRVATELLPELGFKPDELADLASGKSKLSIYEHRIQRLLADALKLSDIQKAPKAIAAKPVPPVQRPGVARAAGSNDSEKIQALEARLTQTGSLKDAEALLNAQLAAQSRRRAS